MFLADDILLSPLKGVLWLCDHLRQAAERESMDEEPIYQAILETELAFEEGRLEKAEYETRQEDLMSALRSIKERKKAASQAAVETGPISGAASLEIDLDLGGYGPGEKGGR